MSGRWGYKEKRQKWNQPPHVSISWMLDLVIHGVNVEATRVRYELRRQEWRAAGIRFSFFLKSDVTIERDSRWPKARCEPMKTPRLEAMLDYLEWHGDEEEHDAQFLEECASKFSAVRQPFLASAKIRRKRARNIRANVETLRRITSV